MADKTSLISYATNGLTAVMGVVTMENTAVLIGIFLGLATYITNLVFQNRREKRDIEIHKLKIKSMKAPK